MSTEAPITDADIEFARQLVRLGPNLGLSPPSAARMMGFVIRLMAKGGGQAMGRSDDELVLLLLQHVEDGLNLAEHNADIKAAFKAAATTHHNHTH